MTSFGEPCGCQVRRSTGFHPALIRVFDVACRRVRLLYACTAVPMEAYGIEAKRC